MKRSKWPPSIEPTAGSDLQGTVSPKYVNPEDGVHRPIFIADFGYQMELTVDEARRLLVFLNEAIPYMEAIC